MAEIAEEGGGGHKKGKKKRKETVGPHRYDPNGRLSVLTPNVFCAYIYF
jgi:hypothetical protein